MSNTDYSSILHSAHSQYENIRTWRRQIHQTPELSYREKETANLVNSVLSGIGIKTKTGVAKTGVMAEICGQGDLIVALRADMDALPITEENDINFASKCPGIMHACGHDAHTAMLMGAAIILNKLANENRLPGKVRLLFQPSEETHDSEGKSGARRMIEEGALVGVDAVFALHVAPAFDVGFVATRTGPLYAASDDFSITIRGCGGHAARPQDAIDPIALSSHVINAIQQIISRRLPPTEPGVITLGTIHGGTTNNVIPDSVTITGTARSFSPAVRILLQEELHKATQIVESLGAKAELVIAPGCPALINDSVATTLAKNVAAEILGHDKIIESELMMSCEDFSLMAQAVPGCMLRLGVHNPSWPKFYPVHRSDFRIDEDALPIGTAILAATALEWMKRKARKP